MSRLFVHGAAVVTRLALYRANSGGTTYIYYKEAIAHSVGSCVSDLICLERARNFLSARPSNIKQSDIHPAVGITMRFPCFKVAATQDHGAGHQVSTIGGGSLNYAIWKTLVVAAA